MKKFNILIILFAFLFQFAFSKTVLWDLSHGVSWDNTPDGYYKSLTNNLSTNGFTVDSTLDGVLAEDMSLYDAVVVNLGSNYYCSYTPQEVELIHQFVKQGGGLLIMADNDDCPNKYIEPVSSAFGVHVGLSQEHPSDTYITNVASHDVFDGINEIYMRASGRVASSGILSELAWSDDTGDAMIIGGDYGEGHVLVIGDINIFSTDYNDAYHKVDNQQFSINVFEYLVIPEPCSLSLLAIGAFLAGKKRKNYSIERNRTY